MVTPAEPGITEEVQVDSYEPDSDVDEGLPDPEPDMEAVEEAEPTDTSAPVPSSQAPPEAPVAPRAPKVDRRAVEELQQRRAYDMQRNWQVNVTKQAKSYQQQLENAGYMPEQAVDQAKRYVRQEQKFRKQEDEAAEMLGFIEGRQVAAIHFMEKHGLAEKQMLADLRALQQTGTPAEMEKEARRIKQDRNLRAENARLKQGQVPSQTFDNSQGSASASSNDQRLLDAYISGDRSEAAIAAVRRTMQ